MAARAPRSELDVLECRDAASWAGWLQKNHADSPGVWLKIAKKSAPVATVGYPEALEHAICHGWIDGQKRGLDESYWLQRFTPRGPRSKWSEINREKATRLMEEGRMHAGGLAQVEAARADGRWDAAYAPQSRITVPDDLQQALDQNPEAAAFFATLTGARRYAFLYRLGHLRDPLRRAQRIAEYIVILSERRTLN